MQHPTFYRTIQIDEVSIFYREAGPKDAPTLLLLHGLPSSSRMSNLCSLDSPTDITSSRPIILALDTATGLIRKNSPIRSITAPKS